MALTASLQRLVAHFDRLLSYLPLSVSSKYRAANFLIRLTLSTAPRVPFRPASVGRFRAKVFRTAAVPTHHTVLLLHGLSPSGFDDARILDLAHALAAAFPALCVVVPHLPLIAACNLGQSAQREVREAVCCVRDDPALCPTAQISLVSACVSAGMALNATAHTHGVRALLAFGAHADVENVMQFCLRQGSGDDARYAINAFLLNFWKPINTALRQMLVAALRDDHFSRDDGQLAELPSMCDKYPEEAQLYRRVHEDKQFQRDVLSSAYRLNNADFDCLSPVRRVAKFRCKAVVLVHGSIDGIVPSSESLFMYERLQALAPTIRSALVITRALNHGDKQPLSLRLLADGIRLVNAFSLFYEHV